MTTNYERIKNMTVEELAEFITNYMHCDTCPVTNECWENGGYTEKGDWNSCQQWYGKWLQAESEE